jgi:hypothetical protein
VPGGAHSISARCALGRTLSTLSVIVELGRSARDCENHRMRRSAPSGAQRVWPELTDWHPTGMAESVYRARTTDGSEVYVRPDNGSVELLRRLTRTDIPAPRVLAVRQGWLMLSALPGIPLCDSVLLSRRADATPSPLMLCVDWTAREFGTATCACPTSWSIR